MPKPRWIDYEGRQWRLTELAKEHHLSVGALAYRLERLPLDRALATGHCSRQAAGKRAKHRTSWS